MKKKYYSAFFALALLPVALQAQTPYSTREYINAGKISAPVMLHGDLFWNPGTASAACEFPKGEGTMIMSATSLWIGGYNGNTLHQSAQTYRQSGHDYWPGPLDNNGATTAGTVDAWAKIWKIEKADIDAYLAQTSHKLSNTPASILEWPAKGNPYAKGNKVPLTISTDMAPFIDANGDGQYDPLSGDYPAIQGDQMLWWVMNDNGLTHDNSSNMGSPLKMEIQAKAFAFNRGTLADNIVFFEYTLLNRSSVSYTNFRAGIFADCDLGYFGDDFIGFDSSRRLGYVYNGNATDGGALPGYFGTSIPVAGITLLHTPGDAAGNIKPAGSFMYFNFDNSPVGTPVSDVDFSNYMRAHLRNGEPLRNDFSPGSISKGYGSGPVSNYVFTGDPLNKAEWSECASVNPPDDRNFVIASADHSFAAGGIQTFAFALVATDPSANNACPSMSNAGIKKVADTAWSIYNDLQKLSVAQIGASQPLSIFPNPAKGLLHITTGKQHTTGLRLSLYDCTGKMLAVTPTADGDGWQIDVQSLPTGVYYIRAVGVHEEYKGSFIKN